MSLSLQQYRQTWTSILATIKKNPRIDRHLFDAFFSGTYLYKVDGTKMIIAAIGKTEAEMLTNSYIDLILEAVNKVTESEFVIEIVSAKDVEATAEIPPSKQFFKDHHVLTNFTFDNFVVGNSNSTAFQSALMIANDQGAFNPLFIYSKSGLGKTHLINAIGNYVKSQKPEKNVLYLNTNDFVEEFVKYIRGDQDQETFKSFFKTVDYLLIDDIQFLSGKKSTAEMFFHIFNDMVNAKKQIVLTSDRPPSDLNGLEERLVTRFISGQTVMIKRPDYDTLISILKAKIEATGLQLSSFDEDVLDYMAENYSKNIRDLEGALNRLYFQVIMHKSEGHITLAMAKDDSVCLGEKPGAVKQLTIDKIIDVTAEYYNLTADLVKSRSRTSQIALARQITMYLCRCLLDISYDQIGKEFGNRDHSTVMTSVEKVDKMLKTDKALIKVIEEIKVKLK